MSQPSTSGSKSTSNVGGAACSAAATISFRYVTRSSGPAAAAAGGSGPDTAPRARPDLAAASIRLNLAVRRRLSRSASVGSSWWRDLAQRACRIPTTSKTTGFVSQSSGPSNSHRSIPAVARARPEGLGSRPGPRSPASVPISTREAATSRSVRSGRVNSARPRARRPRSGPGPKAPGRTRCAEGSESEWRSVSRSPSRTDVCPTGDGPRGPLPEPGPPARSSQGRRASAITGPRISRANR